MYPHRTQEETDFLSTSASQDCSDHVYFALRWSMKACIYVYWEKKIYFKLYWAFIIFTVPSSYPALPGNGLSCKDEHLFSALFWRLEPNLHRFFRGKLSSSVLFLALFNLWYFIGTLKKRIKSIHFLHKIHIKWCIRNKIFSDIKLGLFPQIVLQQLLPQKFTLKHLISDSAK